MAPAWQKQVPGTGKSVLILPFQVNVYPDTAGTLEEALFTLEDPRAIVATGAVSGIGLAIARIVALAGGRVALVDLDGAAVERIAGDIEGTRGFGCDVSYSVNVASAFANIDSRHGGASQILVNFAGIAHVGLLATTTPEDLDRLYNVNVRGTYLAMRAILPGMVKANEGVILNMASIAPLPALRIALPLQ